MNEINTSGINQFSEMLNNEPSDDMKKPADGWDAYYGRLKRQQKLTAGIEADNEIQAYLRSPECRFDETTFKRCDEWAKKRFGFDCLRGDALNGHDLKQFDSPTEYARTVLDVIKRGTQAIVTPQYVEAIKAKAQGEDALDKYLGVEHTAYVHGSRSITGSTMGDIVDRMPEEIAKEREEKFGKILSQNFIAVYEGYNDAFAFTPEEDKIIASAVRSRDGLKDEERKSDFERLAYENPERAAIVLDLIKRTKKDQYGWIRDAFFEIAENWESQFGGMFRATERFGERIGTELGFRNVIDESGKRYYWNDAENAEYARLKEAYDEKTGSYPSWPVPSGFPQLPDPETRVNQICAARMARESLPDEERKNRRRAELMLEEASKHAPIDHGFLYSMVVGGVSTIPYMVQSMGGPVGFAAIAVNQFENTRDQILMAGGDPDVAVGTQLLLAGAWAAVERLQLEGIFGKTFTDLQKRSILMHVADTAWRKNKLKAIGNLVRTAGPEYAMANLSELTAEGLQGAIEKGTIAAFSTKDAEKTISAAMEGFATDFRKSVPTMIGLTAIGTWKKYSRTRKHAYDINSLNDFSAKYVRAVNIFRNTLADPAEAKSAGEQEVDNWKNKTAKEMWYDCVSIWRKHLDERDGGVTALDEIREKYSLNEEQVRQVGEAIDLRENLLDTARIMDSDDAAKFVASFAGGFRVGNDTTYDPVDLLHLVNPDITVEDVEVDDRTRNPTQKPVSPETQELRDRLSAAQARIDNAKVGSERRAAEREYRRINRKLKNAEAKEEAPTYPKMRVRRVTVPVGKSGETRSFTIAEDREGPDINTKGYASSVADAMKEPLAAGQVADGAKITTEDFKQLPFEVKATYAVTPEQYMAMTNDERDSYCRAWTLKTGGDFYIIDDMTGKEVFGTDAMVQIMRSFQNPHTRVGGNWTLAHEYGHAISEFARAVGILKTDSKSVAVMRKLFGDPTNDKELWDEEAANNGFAEYLRGKYDFRRLTPEERKATRGFFRNMLATLRGIFSLSGRELPDTPVERTEREQAMDAAFEAMRTGDFSGLDAFAGIDFAEDAKPSPDAAAPAPAPAPNAEVQPAPAPTATYRPVAPENAPYHTGKKRTLKTPDRTMQVEYEWVWFSAADNKPAFGDYQDRKSRLTDDASNDVQTLKMSRPRRKTDNGREEGFDAEAMLGSAETDRGAPIVVGGGLPLIAVLPESERERVVDMTASGNGRMLTINKLIEEGRFDEYLNPALAFARENGIPLPPENMEYPVLKRRIVGGESLKTRQDLVDFCRKSNGSAIKEHSNVENATNTVDILDDKLFRLFNPSSDGDLLAVSNRPFMDAYLNAIEKAGIDISGLRNSDLTPTMEASTRVERSLIAKMFGNDMKAVQLVSYLLEKSRALSLGRLRDALISNAAKLFAMKQRRGSFDIVDDVREAAYQYITWRVASKSSPGLTLADHLMQINFDDNASPMQQALAKLLEAGRFGATLDKYAELVAQQAEDAQGTFAGIAEKRTPLQLLGLAERALLPEGESPVTPDPASPEAAAPVQTPPAVRVEPSPAPTAQGGETPVDSAQTVLTPPEPTTFVPAPVKRGTATLPGPGAAGIDGYQVNADGKPTTDKKNLPPGAYNLLRAPYDVRRPPANSAQDKAGRGLYIANPPPTGHADIFPHFQGNKTDMAARTSQAVRRIMPKAEREHYETVVDYFGGGGCWGLYHALENFPNAKYLVINEWDAGRIAKIRLLQEIDGEVADRARELIRPFYEDLRAACTVGDDGSESGSGTTIANKLEPFMRKYEGDDLGILTALYDCAHTMLANRTDETGKPSFDAGMEAIYANLREDGRKAKAAADEFKARGGTIRYRQGDASNFPDAPKGDRVVAVCDPPYYRTAGYNGQLSVPLDANGNGWDYLTTDRMLKDLVDSGDAIVYTDEAWWHKENYNPNPSEGSDLFGNKSDFDLEQETLLDIINTLDHFDVAGRVVGRQEVLGIHHGHDTESEGREIASRDGSGIQRNTGDEIGNADDARHSVRRMAGGAEDEGGTVLVSGSGRGREGLRAIAREVIVQDISASLGEAAGATAFMPSVDSIVRSSVRQVREDRMADYARTVSKNAKRWIAKAQRDLDAHMAAHGYTEKVWHGTNGPDFNEFAFSSVSHDVPAAYFTYSHGTAQNYAALRAEDYDENGQPNTRQFYVNPGNVLDLDEDADPTTLEDFIAKLKDAYEQGYDSVRVKNAYDDQGMRLDENDNGEPQFIATEEEPELKTDILIVFDRPGNPGPNRIKAAEPVTFLNDTDGALPIPLEMRADQSMPDVRFSVSRVYTGSRADYDSPSLIHVGTGEGAQVYGWGLYGSAVRGVAEGYARREEYTTPEHATKDGRELRRFIPYNGEEHLPTEELVGEAIVKAEGDVEKAKKFLENYLKAKERFNEALPSQYAINLVSNARRAIEELAENGHRYSFVEERTTPASKGNIYEQTFFTNRADGDESHLLSWYDPVSDYQLDLIESQLNKEGLLDNEKSLQAMRFLRGELPSPDQGKNKNGNMVYGQLRLILGSPKAASEFLARADIDGIKYPVDSYGNKSVKDGDKVGWNYVSFRDDNINVDHKWVDGVQRYSVQLDRHFKPAADGDIDMPIARLVSMKNEPQESIDHAIQLMTKASDGNLERRDPVSVADNGDGTYTIVDGNATSRALAQMGADSVRVRVVGPNRGTRFLNSAYLVKTIKPEGGLLVEGATDLDKAFDIAIENADALADIIKACASKVNGEVHMRKTDPETGKPTKKRASAERKVRDEYDGDARKLVDLIGGTVVMEDDSDLKDAVKAITKNLPEGASIAKVKMIGFDSVGYQDVKVSVKFANGGVGEIILVNRYIYEAKEQRGGHDVYKIARLLKPMAKSSPEASKAYTDIDIISRDIYSRGPEAPDQEAWERAKANASSSCTFLSGVLSAEHTSSWLIHSLKSSSATIYLAKPPSVNSYAMPASSLIKNIPNTSLSTGIIPYSAAQNQPRYSVRTSFSPDFPKVVAHTTRKNIMEKYGDLFRKAKAGDMEAAADLIEKVVKPEKIRAIIAAHPNASIVVPVYAEEATGHNQLPAKFADYISALTGIESDKSIVQRVRAFHSGSKADHRLFSQPEFDGPVKRGAEYIIVDDHITQGGTVNALRDHIESNGGKVVAVSALTLSHGSSILSPQKDTIDETIRKWPDIDRLLRKAGIADRADALTESQLRYINQFSPDGFRNRISQEVETGIARAQYEALGIPSEGVAREETEAERAAMRHSVFVGYKATNSKAFDVNPLLDAAMMLQTGFNGRYTAKARDEIYAKTGWWKGTDGLWRFEIPDMKPRKRGETVKSAIDDEYVAINGLREYGDSPAKWCNLTDMVSHTKLFKAYPELKNVIVDIVDPDSVDFSGQYNPNRNRITLTWDAVKWFDDEPSNVLNLDGLKTLTHEIQHAVQYIEGFAKGGSPDAHGERNYGRLAGEVEARNASRRIGGFFSELTSRGTGPRNLAIDNSMTPWDTEDVPGRKQIIADEYGSMTDVNGRKVARQSVRSQSGGHRVDDLATALIASRRLAGKDVSVEDADRIVRNLGIKGRASDIVERANALADRNREKLRDMIERKDPSIVATLAQQGLADSLARNLDDLITGTAATADPDIGAKVQQAIQSKATRDLMNAHGFDAAQMMAELPVDLAKAIFAVAEYEKTPEELARLEAARRKREEERAEEQAQAEALGLTLEEYREQKAREELDDTSYREPTDEERAKLDALLDRARFMEEARKAEEERKKAVRKRKAAEAGDTADGSSEEGEGGEGGEADGPTLPAETLRRIAPVFESADLFASFIVEWTADHVAAKHPNIPSTAEMWRNPIAVRELKQTATHILRRLANDVLGSPSLNYARNFADHAINELESDAECMTFNAVRRKISRIYDQIHTNALNLSRRSMVRELAKKIRKKAIERGRFSAVKEDLKRKIDAKTEQWCRWLVPALTMSEEKLQAEIDRLTALVTADPADERATPEDRLREAADHLAVLHKYGGMVRWMPGRIADAETEIMAQLDGRRQEFETRREERLARDKAIRDAIVAAVQQGAASSYRKHTKLGDATNRYTSAMMGNLTLEMQNLIRHCTDPALRKTALEAIEEMQTWISEGGSRYRTILGMAQAELHEGLALCYGNAEAGIRHLLRDEIPTEAANAIFTQGKDRVPTYGQLLQLYASTIQADYKGNAEQHGRTDALPLMENTLTDADRRFHAWSVEWFRRNRKALSDSVEAVTGLPVTSPDALYTPVRILREKTGFDAEGMGWSPVPSALNRRIQHDLDFNEGANFLACLQEQAEVRAQTIGYAETGIRLRDTIAHRDVQSAVRKNVGKADMKVVTDHVRDVLVQNATRKDESAFWAPLNVARKWMARFYLSGNIPSAVKQLASMPVWANAMIGGETVGIMRCLKYLTTVGTEEGRAALRELMDSDGFKARYIMGWSEETQNLLLNPSRNRVMRYIEKAYDKGMIVNKAVDGVSCLWMAQGFYRDATQSFIDKGLPPDEAKRKAMALTWSCLESGQQSGRVENMNTLQRRGGAGVAAIFQFKTAYLLQNNYLIQAMREMKAGTPGARGRFLRALFVNTVWIPAFVATVNAAWEAVMGEPEPPEDEESWPTWFKAMCWSMIDGVTAPMFGLDSALHTLYDQMTNTKNWRQDGEMPALSGAIRVSRDAARVVYDLGKYGLQAFDAFDFEEELTGEKLGKDVNRLVKDLLAPYRHGARAIENRMENNE